MGNDLMAQYIATQVEEGVTRAMEDRFASLENMLENAIGCERIHHLSIKNAAERGGLSYDHVRRAIESRELPASDKGNGQRHIYRIARPDFDRWMQKNKGGKHLPPSNELKQKKKRYLPGLSD